MNKFTMVAIDSSTKKSGCAVFENGIYTESTVLDTSKIKLIDDRFESMASDLWDYLEKYKPKMVVIEETVVNRNVQVQRFLTRLQGIVYAWCMQSNAFFATLRPSEWRRHVGIKQGKGVKREELKKEAVRKVNDIFHITVSDDEAESILIGLASVDIYTNEG